MTDNTLTTTVQPQSPPSREPIDPSRVLIRVQDLKKYFPIKRGVLRKTVGHIKAVDGVSFEIYKGETLGLAA